MARNFTQVRIEFPIHPFSFSKSFPRDWQFDKYLHSLSICRGNHLSFARRIVFRREKNHGLRARSLVIKLMKTLQFTLKNYVRVVRTPGYMGDYSLSAVAYFSSAFIFFALEKIHHLRTKTFSQSVWKRKFSSAVINCYIERGNSSVFASSINERKCSKFNIVKSLLVYATKNERRQNLWGGILILSNKQTEIRNETTKNSPKKQQMGPQHFKDL